MMRLFVKYKSLSVCPGWVAARRTIHRQSSATSVPQHLSYPLLVRAVSYTESFITVAMILVIVVIAGLRYHLIN